MATVFGEVQAITAEEYRRVTEVTYLGVVYGTLTALHSMLPRDRGVIVQVGSALAYRGIPLQSAYCAAKHAIQGFTESLRCELLHQSSGVRVTMVQLPALNTPQFEVVRARVRHHPRPVAPVYQPEVAARAILAAAEHPARREWWVGASTALSVMGNAIVPGAGDRYLARTNYKAQMAEDTIAPDRPDNLFAPVRGDHGARGRFSEESAERSAQWALTRHRRVLAGAGLASGLAARRRRRQAARPMKASDQPALADYSLIGDCHGAALVSSEGSIDWCCLPRFDSGSCFARLLDQERGGHCSVSLRGGVVESSSAYLEDTMVLETTLQGAEGSVRVLDFMAIAERSEQSSRREIVRVIECSQGAAEVQVQIAPRFDYGEVTPWLRRAAKDSFTAIGGDDGLAIWSDGELESDGEQLTASAKLNDGERLCLLIRHVRPHLLEKEQLSEDGEQIDARLRETVRWWRAWRKRLSGAGSEHPAAVRSALLLKALTYAPTGAIVAAPTTSLPETPAGERNWDYRFSWIRDSSLAARSLAELGCEREAERFGRFIVRASAGHAEDLQILFGVGGERRHHRAGAHPARLPRRPARARRQPGRRAAAARRAGGDAQPGLALASSRALARRR